MDVRITMTKQIERTEPRIEESLPQEESSLGFRESRSAGRAGRIERLRLLWTHRAFLFRAAAAGLVLSAAIAFLISSRYESAARLMPPDANNSGTAALLSSAVRNSTLGGAGLGALDTTSIGSDLLGLKNTGDLFVGILRSRTVEADVVTKFDLAKVYRDRRSDDAQKELASNVDVGVDRKSGIITIKVTDKNPQRAAAIAQEYLEELDRVVTNSNNSAAHRERVFLEGRLEQVKQDLELAEKNFSQFAIDIQAQGKAMIESAAALQGQLIEAQTELQGLKQMYTDENVRVRSVRARVNELQRQLQQLGGQFDDADSSRESNPQSMYPSIRKLPLLGVNYADLYRGTKIQEAIFQALTQEYELAKVQEAKETPSVKVLDAPNVPESKSFPPRLVIILAGVIVLFLSASLWVIASDAWQAVDRHDPGKLLATEMWGSARAMIFPPAQNGSSLLGLSSRIFARFRKEREVDNH
jgi:capsule polysaccharide export protein KpsE/RkpR